MEMSEVFIPSPTFPLHHFVIEWTAEIWENTPAMYAAMEAKGKPYPYRYDTLEQPFALHACSWVHPDDSPKHYHLEAADSRYYEKIILDRLVNANLSTVALFLNWNLERAANPSGFIDYVENLIQTDSNRLTPEYLWLEAKERDFRETYTWLEIKRNSRANTALPFVAPSHNENDSLEKRALSNRAYMLMLLVMQVPDELRGADQNKQAKVWSSLIGLNTKRTYQIMFSGKEEDDPYSYKVVRDLYNFCESNEILMTPFGVKVERLWSETQSKMDHGDKIM